MADATLRFNGPGTQARAIFRSSRPSVELTLFLASMVTLYFELLIIRYVSSEVRVFANLKNLPLVASFFGIGLGMLLGNPVMRFRAAFPAATALLFILTRFAMPLHLSFGDMSWEFAVGSGGLSSRFPYVISFLAVSLGYSALIIVFSGSWAGMWANTSNACHLSQAMGSTCLVVWREWRCFRSSLSCIWDQRRGCCWDSSCLLLWWLAIASRCSCLQW